METLMRTLTVVGLFVCCAAKMIKSEVRTRKPILTSVCFSENSQVAVEPLKVRVGLAIWIKAQ